MPRMLGTFLAVCCSILIVANVASAQSPKPVPPPSSGAVGMPGALGTFEFQPEPAKPGVTTFWIDTDGVAPGVVGCHFAVENNGAQIQIARFFGELCLPNGRLVESNPGANELHNHTNDKGNPDQFECNVYCIGQGSTGGMCTVAPAPPPCGDSAMCKCN